MEITLENYFDRLEEVLDVIEGNEDLRTAHQFFLSATENGTSFYAYDVNNSIRETINLYLETLNAFKEKQKRVAKPKSPTTPKPKEQAAPRQQAKQAKEKSTAAKPLVKKGVDKEPEHDIEQVAHIPSDIALVKRYVSLHNKQKSYDQVLAIWRAFNKAIVERKITKDSPYKSEIEAMNSSLKAAIPAAEGTGAIHMVIPAAPLKRYKAIAESVEKSVGVSMLLELLNIAGRPGMEERADKLSKRIDRALQSGKLQQDRYLKEVKSARKVLESYVNKETDVIAIDDYTLSGIGEVAVFGCPCPNGVDGFSSSQHAVIDKLISEKVKNLRDGELDRAFADTVAPSICKAIARRLMDSRQLNMSLIRNPAKSTGAQALNGSGEYDFDTEILDMRLRSAGAGSGQMGAKSRDTGIVGLEGVGSIPAPEQGVKIISAIDMMSLTFKTLGLKGKYRELIGDPEPGFSAMISGKPKEGKSTLAIDFAKELTPYGRTLYCVYEEGHGMLLQDKIIRNKANVPGLDFANKMPAPEELSLYKFIFIDSVSDARMTAELFGQLIKTCKPKGISIIGIFHATKDGKFRGGQTYAHDVDIMIDVAGGIAHARGRYGPPGEMSIAALLGKAAVGCQP